MPQCKHEESVGGYRWYCISDAGHNGPHRYDYEIHGWGAGEVTALRADVARLTRELEEARAEAGRLRGELEAATKMCGLCHGDGTWLYQSSGYHHAETMPCMEPRCVRARAALTPSGGSR